MQLQYPGESEHDGHGHGFDGFAAFSNALLNPSPFIGGAPRTGLDGSDSVQAHGGLSAHGCGSTTQLELSLPQDIAAPRPVPYATYLHATSLQEQPTQSQSQSQSTLHDHEEQHGLAGHGIHHEHDPLATNSAVQWDGHLAEFAQEHGDRDEGHQFYARAGESVRDIQMDEEEAAATAVALQARFEAMAAQAGAGTAGVGMEMALGTPLTMAELYHHGELRCPCN